MQSSLNLIAIVVLLACLFGIWYAQHEIEKHASRVNSLQSEVDILTAQLATTKHELQETKNKLLYLTALTDAQKKMSSHPVPHVLSTPGS